MLNKVAYHIKNRISEPLNVGNLDSYRNIIHASDAASAINIIISQNYGDNYIICGNESNKMIDLVKKMYNLSGIELIQKENNCYYSLNFESNPVLIVDECGFNDFVPTNIKGKSVKLEKLGWSPVYSVEDIIKELLI